MGVWKRIERILFGKAPDPENCTCQCHQFPFLLLRCYRCLACPTERR